MLQLEQNRKCFATSCVVCTTCKSSNWMFVCGVTSFKARCLFAWGTTSCTLLFMEQKIFLSNKYKINPYQSFPCLARVAFCCQEQKKNVESIMSSAGFSLCSINPVHPIKLNKSNNRQAW